MSDDERVGQDEDGAVAGGGPSRAALEGDSGGATVIDLRDPVIPQGVHRRHLHGRPRPDTGLGDLQRYRDVRTHPLGPPPGDTRHVTSPRSPEPAPWVPATDRRTIPAADPARQASLLDVAIAVAPAPDLDGLTPSLTPLPGSVAVAQGVDLLVIQRIRLRSVLKMSAGLYLSALAVIQVAGVVLWTLASHEGWVSNWTDFLVTLGFEGAAVDGGALLRASVLLGLGLVVVAVALTLVTATVYNQLSALLGGLEFTFRSRARRVRRRHRKVST